MLATRQVEIISKKIFIVAVLHIENKIFVVHITALAELTNIPIQLFYKAQVILLTSIEISIKYSKFLVIFSLNSIVELLKHSKINNSSINLLVNKLFYSLIYSLVLIEFETLKTYIKANLTSNFIRLFKFFLLL